MHAAIEGDLAAVDELGPVMAMLPLGDLRSEMTPMARWNLGSLQRRGTLTNLPRREARRLPPELLDQLYDRLVERPYRQVVAWLEQRCTAAGVDPPDLAALAVVLVESMAAYRLMGDTFGRTFDNLDDERFIAGWVDIAMAVARRHGLE